VIAKEISYELGDSIMKQNSLVKTQAQFKKLNKLNKKFVEQHDKLRQINQLMTERCKIENKIISMIC
jgi:hypothetical protein